MPSEITPTQERAATPGGAQAPQFNPFDALWNFLTSTRIAVFLIFLTLIAAFIGAIFVQAPGWAHTSPLEYSAWLERIRPRYGPLTNIYSALGVFDTYGSVWFRALCGLLIVNTIACTVNRIPGIWRSVFRSKAVMSDNFYTGSTNRAAVASPVPLEKVLGALRKQRYSITQKNEGDTTYVYADRNGWAKLGTMLTHLSIVLFLAGALTGVLMGWSDDEVIIGEGRTWQMPRGYNFQILLNDFTEEWYPEGMPKDYRSDLTVIDGGQEVERQTIRVNEPLVYKGVKFSQSFYGVAPAVEVKDATGKVVYSDIMVMNPSSTRANYEASSLPVGQNAMLTVMRPKNPRGAAAARLEWQLFSGNKRDQGTLDVGKSVQAGDMQITFQGDREYTGLRVSRDPGTGIIWLASGLMLIGMCSTFYFPRRRLWARVRPGGIEMAAFADRSVQIGTELQSIAKELAPEGARSKRTKRQTREF